MDKILILTVPDVQSLLDLKKIDAAFKRVILVCFKKEEMKQCWNTAREIVSPNTMVSTVWASPNAEQVLADIYARIGKRESNPSFYFSTLKGTRDERKVVQYIKEGLLPVFSRRFANGHSALH